ncbi:hypothetical protein PVAP13_3KG439700 [Panicum virgatum]|uniref:Uncharacterized protein n=1 Tax=Panicum virgatum TaxID=38727 RepID=A0A8T0V5S5_PANVG|nr:hypothetical protein PVAP13_3KG439700 [Panicum virgatum]
MCLLPPPVQKFAGFQTSAVRSGSSWRSSPDPQKSWKRLHISEGKKSRSRKVKQGEICPKHNDDEVIICIPQAQHSNEGKIW